MRGARGIGWDTASSAALCLTTGPMPQNDMVKRLLWSGVLAAVGALASVVATRVAAQIWRQIYHEDPPE